LRKLAACPTLSPEKSWQYPRLVNTSAPAGRLTLVELAIVLMIASLTFLFLLGPTSTMLNIDKRRTTLSKLSALEQAITLFVMQQRRLPCPANGTVDAASAGAGQEMRDAAGLCTGNQQNGVIPWVSLGLTAADAEDGWNNRITYRVDSPALTVADALNLTDCDPVGTALPGGSSTSAYCQYVPGCFTSSPWSLCARLNGVLSGKGLDVRDSGGDTLMDKTGAATSGNFTGAAYLSISHGESRSGGFPSGGGAVVTGTSGTEEARNDANLALQSFYVDGPENYNADSPAHFDDIIIRPTIMTVAARAKLDPRPK
jgi:hypothetical protein